MGSYRIVSRETGYAWDRWARIEPGDFCLLTAASIASSLVGFRVTGFDRQGRSVLVIVDWDKANGFSPLLIEGPHLASIFSVAQGDVSEIRIEFFWTGEIPTTDGVLLFKKSAISEELKLK